MEDFFWRALSGGQVRYTVGGATVRRMAPGFATLMAAVSAEQPDFDALAPHCLPGERLHCIGWSGTAPVGWRVETEATLCVFVWDGAPPAEDGTFEATTLGPWHVPEILHLVDQARPGPFGPRHLELGDYVGSFSYGRLVAMAGERLHAGRWREISAVCTEASNRRRGLAQGLVRTLVRRQLARRETPLLHVRLENSAARDMYTAMGFREARRQLVRVVARGT